MRSLRFRAIGFMGRTWMVVVAISLLLPAAMTILHPGKANAANFQMQTGSYTGTGASLQIRGLGFTPSMVMIKSSTTAGVMVFKTSAMAAANTAYTSATADNTATNITLVSDGFNVGTLVNVNSANVLYYWTAFSGSDCSATGNFCVGTYTGNNSSPRTITTGFQPAFVMVKRSTAVEGHFRTANQPANETVFFGTTARDTAGSYIRSFGATGFDVGATDNANSATYYYVAFKSTAGALSTGTYTGNATDNRDITGAGFVPDTVIVKNATSATTASRNTQVNFQSSYGDSTSYVGTATANQAGSIKLLQTDGFRVGTVAQANESGATFYWVAFGGAAGYSSSGTYQMDTGTYTGTGSSLSISGLGFAPDLVIIKDPSTNYAVFRTSQMAGDTTAYLANAVANFAGGITALGSDGFTVGTSTTTNVSSTVYQWQAFGNAYESHDNSGASDFAVGAYYGNGGDSRNITALPWQPDMVAVKRNGATAGLWRSSAIAGDLTAAFGATNETANGIQALNADGFQVGTVAGVNTSANLYHWFAFKAGTNFKVGSYTAGGTATTFYEPDIPPDLVWIKRTTAVAGVMRSSSLGGDATQYFSNLANVTGRITSLVVNGFTLGASQTETNTATGTYRYVAWRIPGSGSLSSNIVDAGGNDVASPGVSMTALPLSFDCGTGTGTLGIAAQKARVQNTTTNTAWSLSIAPTSGTGAVWSSGGDSYDFNDTNGSPAGCSDGLDTDGVGGQLSIDPSGATITPATGCANTGVSLGGSAAFAQAVTDAITLASASGSAADNCYWDITGVDLSQKVPSEQPQGTYTLNLTVTVTAN